MPFPGGALIFVAAGAGRRRIRRFHERGDAMPAPDIRECAVCAWRETCRLKWRNEINGALHCPEYTYDLRLAQAHPQAENRPGQISPDKE